MSLIVENGTGLADAESYISVADASAYHDKRGNTTWADMSEPEMEQSLRRATDYLVQVYRLRWNGTRVNSVQSLDWPRAFVLREDFNYSGINGYTTIGGNYYYPSNVVPNEVKNACAEMALKASAGELSPDIEQRVTKEKIDVIEVTYSEYGVQYTTYRAIDNMLSPFLGMGGSLSQRKVVRV